MNHSHANYNEHNNSEIILSMPLESSSNTKSESVVPWSSWIPGNLSSIISNTGSIVTRMASSVIYGKVETEKMNSGIMKKLNICNMRLDELRRTRLELETEYNSAVIATKNIESKYNNNLEFIRNKIDDLRIHMIQAVDEMSARLDPLRTTGARDNDVIDTYNSLSSLVEKLKEPAGTQFSQLFPHINMDGVKVAVDYSTAISMNKLILQDIAVSRERETPLLKKLEEIKREIVQVEKEVSLIREFQINHARIVSDQVYTPMVSSGIVAIVDDNQLIQNRER